MEKNEEKEAGYYADSKAINQDVDVEITGIRRGDLLYFGSNGNISGMIMLTSKRMSRSPHRK